MLIKMLQVGVVILLATACANSEIPEPKTSTSKSSASASTGSGTPSTSTTAQSAVVYKITSVSIAATNGSATDPYTTQVYFEASGNPITNSCTSTTTSCSCRFSWKEINTTTGSSVAIPRTATTPLKSVQSNRVTCAAPSIYQAEVADGTAIKVTVIPGSSTTGTFTIADYSFTKQATSVATGSFQDAEGRAFDNVMRYSCYEQFKRGMAVESRRRTEGQISNTTTGEVANFISASSFCIAKASTAGAPSDAGCAGLPGAENSAQSYYYNLYIRSTNSTINLSNKRYICPKVAEPLVKTGEPYWPLDSNFAVALSRSADFNVGVEAFSKVGTGDSPDSVSQGCDGVSAGSATSDSFVRSCLGFAAKPNAGGTCPYFKDANGGTRLTYRLRRYIALYPPIFDSDGLMIPAQPQGSDTIYVLDRPVSFTGADVHQPYTMRGPKPCPFAYFDHKGVTATDPAGGPYGGVMPQYRSTNDNAWNRTNVDGIQFPNVDIQNRSCSAAIPLLNADKTIWSIGTVNALNPTMHRLYVRPVRPWAPHYEEDTDFQACAPLASPFRDPPLHFSKDPATGNVSWCAEAYPSQNPLVASLDVRKDTSSDYPGAVLPFTSHVSSNTTAPKCVATLPTIPTTHYPTAGAAYHLRTWQWNQSYAGSNSATAPTSCANSGNGDQTWNATTRVCTRNADLTCDRTVQSAGELWAKFPLLAPAPDVERALAADTTYGCTITYDNGGGKAGKATPKEGCCGTSVNVWTGVTGTDYKILNRSAHLEPGTPCYTPAY